MCSPRDANRSHARTQVGLVVALDEVEADDLLDGLGERARRSASVPPLPSGRIDVACADGSSGLTDDAACGRRRAGPRGTGRATAMPFSCSDSGSCAHSASGAGSRIR